MATALNRRERSRSRLAGRQTASVLAEFGYGDGDIAALAERGVTGPG